jgi:hypothetical protein
MKLLGSFRPLNGEKRNKRPRGRNLVGSSHIQRLQDFRHWSFPTFPWKTGKTKIRSGFMFVGNWPTSIYCMFKHWQRYPTGLALHRAAQPAGVWKARMLRVWNLGGGEACVYCLIMKF